MNVRMLARGNWGYAKFYHRWQCDDVGYSRTFSPPRSLILTRVSYRPNFRYVRRELLRPPVTVAPSSLPIGFRFCFIIVLYLCVCISFNAQCQPLCLDTETGVKTVGYLELWWNQRRLIHSIPIANCRRLIKCFQSFILCISIINICIILTDFWSK